MLKDKLLEELRQVARQEVIRELEMKFTEEKDFESLQRLKRIKFKSEESKYDKNSQLNKGLSQE